ncbi:hypothetical protein BN946_scf184569.g64 [Trametes cinnabarina]|uniref:F-box domain-containing protein n=1 Tax=Pycnoporus cinnabarinus TaxID=5643 RepID=A0A060S8F0_PYCCI|nr:hypothetical protein BN946_scf184569.g64 [Trametes cinnabarina]
MFFTDTERLPYRLEPTPDAIDAAWATIHSHESAIDDLEDRIQDLLHQVQDLRYDQAKHRASIERCKGLITLARRLPEELLIKIFEHCVEDGWTRAPLVVAHVCSAWRKAALAPKVWSHVYANADDPKALDRTRFWLAMARGANLHVTVVTSWRILPRQIMELMGVLVDRSAQWRSLKVETDSLRHADLVLSQCNQPTPELRSMEIRTAAFDSNGSEGVSDLELRLHESSISDATLQLLNGPRGLCPRLRRLDLRWCGHLHGRALVDLVQSRHVADDLSGPVSDPIEEVGVINCCFVTEDDVLDLARMTVCRLVMREADDYCRTCQCCTNQRYRTRLRLRHITEFMDRNAGIRLVL